MKILCTVCMREGSKGIRNKNLIKIREKYLFDYTLDLAKQCKRITDIVISTDSNKIINILKKKNYNVFFKRSKRLASDNISKLDVIQDALHRSENYYNKKYDYVIDLDVTSPLRILKDINKSISLVINQNANNLFSVNKARKNPYFNMVEMKNNTYRPIKEIKKNIVSRQKAPKVFDMNASIYVWKCDFLKKNKTLFSNKTITYEMPFQRSIDIDDKDDLRYVKYILNNVRL